MKPLEQLCISTDQAKVEEEVGDKNIDAACSKCLTVRPGGSALVWRRKSKHRMRKVKAMNFEFEFEFKKGEEGDAVGKIDQGKTTVMIRHLPNKFKYIELCFSYIFNAFVFLTKKKKNQSRIVGRRIC